MTISLSHVAPENLAQNIFEGTSKNTAFSLISIHLHIHKHPPFFILLFILEAHLWLSSPKLSPRYSFPYRFDCFHTLCCCGNFLAPENTVMSTKHYLGTVPFIHLVWEWNGSYFGIRESGVSKIWNLGVRVKVSFTLPPLTFYPALQAGYSPDPPHRN